MTPATSSGYLPPGSARGLPWGLELPCRGGEQVAASAARGRIRSLIEGPLKPLVAGVAEALDLWWPVRTKVATAAELVVAGPDCGPQVVTLQDPVSRIGRSAACQLRLDGAGIDAEHCELRLDGGRLSLLDLGSISGTVVNGYRLRPFEPRSLEAGDEILLAPFSIVVGACGLDPRQQPARLSLRQPLWLEAEDPFTRLGAATDLWVRLRVGGWEGFLRLPGRWTEQAYQSLDLQLPPGRFGDDELDRAIASFLLERVADAIARQGDQPISLGQVLPAELLWQRQGALSATWEGAIFDLELAGRTAECAVIWAAEQAENRPLVEPRWLAELPFTVSVVAGSLGLAIDSLAEVERGDIVLPDCWLAGGWVASEAEPSAEAADPISLKLGRVRAVVQSLSRSAELEVSPENTGDYHLRWTDSWIQATKGDPMATEREDESNEPQAEASPEAPIQIPKELEVTVSFELDRLRVTLEELSSWSPGGTVELQRKPSDPVRILLHQGASTRVIGSGAVLVVDGRLGVQIDDWQVES